MAPPPPSTDRHVPHSRNEQYDRCRSYSRYLCHDQNDPIDRFFPYARPGSGLNGRGKPDFAEYQFRFGRFDFGRVR